MAKLPGSLNENRRLSRWLKFEDDRTLTVFTGKVELGQGIVTAMAQIAAEELGLGLGQVKMVWGQTTVCPDEGMTAGSRSIEAGGSALRYACAEARQLLLEAASGDLGIPPGNLTVERGIISGFDRIRGLSYWDLPHAVLLDRDATGDCTPKSAAQYSLVGVSVPRLDIPDKVGGRPRFIQDLELPDMVFGRVVRPPCYDAQLIAFDANAVRAVEGVIAVVHDGNFIGVIAQREEQAVKARGVAVRAAQWRGKSLPADDSTIHDYLTSRPASAHLIHDYSGGTPPTPVQSLEARYTKPFIAHASIGPSCAIARIEGESIDVWTHSQGVFPLRHDLSHVLSMEPEAIRVHHVEGSGCYGHNGADDVALDAALLARAVPGRPVHVQWMRDDEFAWEPYGAAMVMRTRGALDSSGRIVDWSLDLWSNSHGARPKADSSDTAASALLASWHIGKKFRRHPSAGSDAPASDGMARNAIADYTLGRQRVTMHRIEEAPLRVSSLRALGAYANVFAVESFMDELAIAAGADPVEFRLRHIEDARAREVIQLAADKAGWRPRTERNSARSQGRGVAYARYKNTGGYLALVVDITLEPELRIERAVVAADVGLAVNPDGLANQIEGGVIQAASWTLKEQVRFNGDGIVSRGWETYPILGFAEAPAVEVHIINRPDEASAGAGELAAGPTAAAIANAVFDALGVRVRDLPLTYERIAALIA